MASDARTYLAYQHDAKLYTLQTLVIGLHPFSELEEANRLLFKQATDDDHVLVTEKTIFHPQGGGQPSDVGTMAHPSGTSFGVSAVRMDVVRDGQVLHVGRFSPATDLLKVGDTV